ncbi:MAG TPA: hypothetical protein PLQ20_02535 [Candidatus Paceibacterota bacterium]|nr:hypothetical protein [Candidatus Paceibacterota bacterium]
MIISLPVKVRARSFSSIEDIEKLGFTIQKTFIDGLGNNPAAIEKVLSEPKDLLEQELIFYCDKSYKEVYPRNLRVFHDYLNYRGFEALENPHPSLLIEAWRLVCDNRLLNEGVVKKSSVVLPSSMGNEIQDNKLKTFFGIARYNYPEKQLCLIGAGGYGPKIILLLRRKTF